MAIATAVQRMAVSQFGGVRQFLTPPSGAVESHDRLTLVLLYPLVVAGLGGRRRFVLGNRWYRMSS